MEVTPKKLVLHNQFGYEENGLGIVPVEQICHKVYPLCWEFIEDMLDMVFSDGPVYFKSYPFGDKKTISIFTTFGNAYTQIDRYKGPFLFQENIFIDSNDFSTFSSENLADYYDTLRVKYAKENLEYLAVYHVLYHPGKEIVVDAYSSWEVE